MSDLFADAAKERINELAPLASRLRPRTLDEFVGQEDVLGEHSALRLAIAEDRVGSMILYGPPGSGKTTLARIVAETTGAAFEELSAVSATVADVLKRAGYTTGIFGRDSRRRDRESRNGRAPRGNGQHGSTRDGRPPAPVAVLLPVGFGCQELSCQKS